jgi:hypothetical protein
MSFAAANSIPHTFSFGILFTLILILAVSGRVFYILTQQWTTHRPLQALREWAGDRRFKLQSPPDLELPESLNGLKSLDPQIELMLIRGPVTLIRLTTAGKPASPRPAWNLVIRETQNAQNPAGLRPANAGASFLDLFSMTGFPSMLPPERFVVFANESRDARHLAATSARGLLPADIGLLIHGPYITLDFSTRPFDVIEFDRMITILEQLTQTEK